MRESTIHQKRPVASAQLEHQNKDPYTQPSEPILFPKLRIYFADFPFLPEFHGPEAANLGCLMQLWVRPGVQVYLSFSFSGPVKSTPNTSDNKVICPPFHPASKQSDFREKAVNKKRQRSTSFPAAPLNSVTLPHNIHTLDVEY